ncbi:MAG: B12-binding domain-containing radical SAM protein [Bacteroidetes bacterium]|nr:B12-binding domain-containing radical SAM protein [Bacteroidota bacterium]
MKKNKIQLINPPLSGNYAKSPRTGVYPPVNLISLATFINSKTSKFEIEILDGEIQSFDDILKSIDAEFVAVGSTILSYSNTLHIAEFAKETGATVIIGGHYASSFPELILKNRKFVDFVIVGDAEIALYELVSGSEVSKINNLTFRQLNSQIKTNKIVKFPMNQIPILDFGLVNLEKYFYRNALKPYKRPFAIFSSKGCSWRSKTKGCNYCGIMHEGWRTKSPEQYWHEIMCYKELYNIDFIWDVSDTIAASKKWLREFALAKPKDIDIGFLFYSRADHIDDEVLDYLSIVNSKELFLGAESGDDNCLSLTNKGYRAEQIFNAVELISSYDIKIIVSFMVGLLGENISSIDNTELMIKNLTKTTEIDEGLVNVMIPMPGSKSFEMIKECTNLKGKYKSCDLIPIEELKKDWLDNFTSISYEEAIFHRDKLLSMFEKGTSYGYLKHV